MEKSRRVDGDFTRDLGSDRIIKGRPRERYIKTNEGYRLTDNGGRQSKEKLYQDEDRVHQNKERLYQGTRTYTERKRVGIPEEEKTVLNSKVGIEDETRSRVNRFDSSLSSIMKRGISSNLGGTEKTEKEVELDPATERYVNSYEFMKLSEEIDMVLELFSTDSENTDYEEDASNTVEDYRNQNTDLPSAISRYKEKVNLEKENIYDSNRKSYTDRSNINLEEENLGSDIENYSKEEIRGLRGTNLESSDTDSGYLGGKSSDNLDSKVSDSGYLRGKDSESINSPKRKNRGRKPLYIIGGIALVSVVCFIGYRVYVVNSRIKDIEDLSVKVSELYTNSKKEEIVEGVSKNKVENYIKSLDNMEYVDTMARYNLEKELDTISYYISDREILEDISSNSYDLNTNGTLEELEGVLESAKDYSVSSLALNINNKAKDLKSSYEYFIELRDEISTITDYSSFDEKGYQLKINKVTHKENKKELQALYDKLVEAKNKEKEIEKLKSEATEEALKKAEELKEKMESELATAREDLVVYKKHLGGMLNDFLEKFKSWFNF